MPLARLFSQKPASLYTQLRPYHAQSPPAALCIFSHPQGENEVPLPNKVSLTSCPFHPCRRINVGSRFQAEIPLMRDRALAAADPHKADLVWQPWENLESSHEKQRQGENQQANTVAAWLCRWVGWS